MSSEMLRFPCPSCGVRLGACPADAGKKKYCPKCRCTFLVPRHMLPIGRLPARTSATNAADEQTDEVPIWIWIMCGVGGLVLVVLLLLAWRDGHREVVTQAKPQASSVASPEKPDSSPKKPDATSKPDSAPKTPETLDRWIFGTWDSDEGESRSIQFVHVNGTTVKIGGGSDVDLGDPGFKPDGGIIVNTAIGSKPGLFRFLQPDGATIECADYFGRKESFALRANGEKLIMTDGSGHSLTLRRSTRGS